MNYTLLEKAMALYEQEQQQQQQQQQSTPDCLHDFEYDSSYGGNSTPLGQNICILFYFQAFCKFLGL